MRSCLGLLGRGNARVSVASRREFLKTLSAIPLAGTQTLAERRLRAAVLITMLPEKLPYEARFAMARAAGFDAIEMRTVSRDEEAAEILEASRRTGLRIHSVMNVDHWEFPLSSADSSIVNRSVAGMETSLRNAALWGADAVLLVPAVVDARTSYRDAWDRSQRVIKERLEPAARERRIIIAVEEVWNKFLLSPIEFSRYVDECASPWVKAYFDVGNVVFYGYPQDWIRTLGSRIVKIHLKDFHLDRPNGRFEWKNLGEGEIDWAAVRQALIDIQYSGYVTTELAGLLPSMKTLKLFPPPLLGTTPPLQLPALFQLPAPPFHVAFTFAAAATPTEVA